MNIKTIPIELVSLRNEVDRFGFSYYLAKKFKLKTTPKSHACFLHGWIWRKDLRIEDMGYYFTPRSTPIVVTTKFQKEIMLQNGFTNITAGGLPFAYIEKSNISRKSDSLLIMPPHSMEYCGFSGLDSNFLKFIDSIKGEFSEICFCLHSDDANNTNVTNKLREIGANFIIGAHPSDVNSLCRMRTIFDYYDYVTTTIMGSHILYAAFCGCKVSLVENFHSILSEKIGKYDLMQRNIPNFLERTLDNLNNKKKLKDQFPWLFVEHPKKAINVIEWANQEIGLSNILEKDCLMNILGWSITAKIKALWRIAYWRFKNMSQILQ